MNPKPFISVILPLYNEEALLEESLKIFIEYLNCREDKFSWEILLIDDGSKDETGNIADRMALNDSRLRVIHHPVNLNLGRALQTGFKNAHGELIVVLDIDQSYSVDHIEKMIDKQIETDADVVVASPYMKNGKVSSVPFKRALMSRAVNRFMQFSCDLKYHTFTGMVRTYKADFIKNLNLKTVNSEINPEILYKAIIMRARIREIPAHLDWSFQNNYVKRKSSLDKTQAFNSGLMAGFIFRPYIFYFTFGWILFLIALYIIGWIFFNTFQAMPQIDVYSGFFDERLSMAIGQVFRKSPHAFIVGGITLMLAIQVLSLGLISLQNKRYFEETFHLATNIYKHTKSSERA